MKVVPMRKMFQKMLIIMNNIMSLFIQINNLSAVDFFKEGRAAKQGRFTASGRTDNADNLAFFHTNISATRPAVVIATCFFSCKNKQR